MAKHTVHTASLCQGKACNEKAKSFIASHSASPITDMNNTYKTMSLDARSNERLHILRNRFDKQLSEYALAQKEYSNAVLNNATKPTRDQLKKHVAELNAELLITAQEIDSNMEVLVKFDHQINKATSQERAIFKKKLAELAKAKKTKTHMLPSFEGEYKDIELKATSMRYKYTLWLLATLIIGFITIQHVRNP